MTQTIEELREEVEFWRRDAVARAWSAACSYNAALEKSDQIRASDIKVGQIDALPDREAMAKTVWNASKMTGNTLNYEDFSDFDKAPYRKIADAIAAWSTCARPALDREGVARALYEREPACGWRFSADKSPRSYAIPWADATAQQREDAYDAADAILATGAGGGSISPSRESVIDECARVADATASRYALMNERAQTAKDIAAAIRALAQTPPTD